MYDPRDLAINRELITICDSQREAILPLSIETSQKKSSEYDPYSNEIMNCEKKKLIIKFHKQDH